MPVATKGFSSLGQGSRRRLYQLPVLMLSLLGVVRLLPCLCCCISFENSVQGERDGRVSVVQSWHTLQRRPGHTWHLTCGHSSCGSCLGSLRVDPAWWLLHLGNCREIPAAVPPLQPGGKPWATEVDQSTIIWSVTKCRTFSLSIYNVFMSFVKWVINVDYQRSSLWDWPQYFALLELWGLFWFALCSFSGFQLLMFYLRKTILTCNLQFF